MNFKSLTICLLTMIFMTTPTVIADVTEAEKAAFRAAENTFNEATIAWNSQKVTLAQDQTTAKNALDAAQLALASVQSTYNLKEEALRQATDAYEKIQKNFDAIKKTYLAKFPAKK